MDLLENFMNIIIKRQKRFGMTSWFSNGTYKGTPKYSSLSGALISVLDI